MCKVRYPHRSIVWSLIAAAALGRRTGQVFAQAAGLIPQGLAGNQIGYLKDSYRAGPERQQRQGDEERSEALAWLSPGKSHERPTSNFQRPTSKEEAGKDVAGASGWFAEGLAGAWGPVAWKSP